VSKEQSEQKWPRHLAVERDTVMEATISDVIVDVRHGSFEGEVLSHATEVSSGSRLGKEATGTRREAVLSEEFTVDSRSGETTTGS